MSDFISRRVFPLRILHIISYFQPHLGYQEYFLAREQARAGHDVYVLTSDRYYPFSSTRHDLPSRLVHEHIQFREGFATIRLKPLCEIGSILCCRGVTEVIDRVSPDVVHSHDIHTVMPAQVPFLRRNKNFGWLIDSHAFFAPFASIPGRMVFRLLKQALYRPALMNADCIVAVSDFSRAWLEKEFQFTAGRVKTIPLGVENDLFRPSSNKAKSFRERMGLSGNTFLVVYAGQIQQLRNIPVLIRAFRLLLHDHPDSTLVLIGNGEREYVERIRRAVRALPVVMCDRVPRHELSEAFNAANVVVFPGGRSISIFEAMSCGSPVVVYEGGTKTQSAKEYVSTGAAISFEKGNHEELHRALMNLVEDRELSDRLSLRGIEVGKDRDWRLISERFVKEYEAIAPRL